MSARAFVCKYSGLCLLALLCVSALAAASSAERPPSSARQLPPSFVVRTGGPLLSSAGSSKRAVQPMGASPSHAPSAFDWPDSASFLPCHPGSCAADPLAASKPPPPRGTLLMPKTKNGAQSATLPQLQIEWDEVQDAHTYVLQRATFVHVMGEFEEVYRGSATRSMQPLPPAQTNEQHIYRVEAHRAHLSERCCASVIRSEALLVPWPTLKRSAWAAPPPLVISGEDTSSTTSNMDNINPFVRDDNTFNSTSIDSDDSSSAGSHAVMVWIVAPVVAMGACIIVAMVCMGWRWHKQRRRHLFAKELAARVAVSEMNALHASAKSGNASSLGGTRSPPTVIIEMCSKPPIPVLPGSFKLTRQGQTPFQTPEHSGAGTGGGGSASTTHHRAEFDGPRTGRYSVTGDGRTASFAEQAMQDNPLVDSRFAF